MKLYRLHDLLRLAALAWTASACGNSQNAGGTAVVAGDATTDAQTGTDAAADVAVDSAATDAVDVDSAADSGATDASVSDLGPGDAGTDAATADSADTSPSDTPAADAKDGGAADSGAKLPFPCVNSSPMLTNGQANGFAQCANGMIHRPEKHNCPAYVPDPNKKCLAGGNCTTDADCAATPGSHCDMGMGTPCFCQPSCNSDADCGTGQICQCGEKYGSCIQASCTSDADCSAGVCGNYTSNPGCDFPAFACQSAADLCAVKSDCDASKYETCTWDVNMGHRYCAPPMCAIGRPFGVDGVWRTAQIQNRDDWMHKLAVDVTHLPQELRAELANHWLEAARMEHASIASFARLTLELLAVGAPPELVERAQSAGMDEVRHARICFGLAQLFGAEAQGPTGLTVAGALIQPTLAEVAAAAAREGCVMETAAALEVQISAQECQIPQVRAALESIAADEANHAELAWDLVKWALTKERTLATGDAQVRAEVEKAFVQAELELRQLPAGEPIAAGLGVLRGDRLRQLRVHALDAVILPSFQRILA